MKPVTSKTLNAVCGTPLIVQEIMKVVFLHYQVAIDIVVMEILAIWEDIAFFGLLLNQAMMVHGTGY